jgi:hypothetical protein
MFKRLLTRRITCRQAAYPLWLILIGGTVSLACIVSLLFLLCQHADRDPNHTFVIAILPLLVICGTCWWFVWSFREKLEVARKKGQDVQVEDGIQDAIVSPPILHAPFQPIDEHAGALPETPNTSPPPGMSRADSSASRKTTESVKSRLEVNHGGLARTMTTRENRADFCSLTRTMTTRESRTGGRNWSNWENRAGGRNWSNSI